MIEMQINEENLLAIGFKNISFGVYELTSLGYSFLVELSLDKSVFITRDRTHSVTHMSEIFGMIAEDYKHIGKKELKKELFDLLKNE